MSLFLPCIGMFTTNTANINKKIINKLLASKESLKVESLRLDMRLYPYQEATCRSAKRLRSHYAGSVEPDLINISVGNKRE